MSNFDPYSRINVYGVHPFEPPKMAVKVGGYELTLPPGSAQPRIDLIAHDGHRLVAIQGEPADQPLPPHVPDGFDVLGQVHVPAYAEVVQRCDMYGWYDHGGSLPAGAVTFRKDSGPERIFTESQWVDFLRGKTSFLDERASDGDDVD